MILAVALTCGAGGCRRRSDEGLEAEPPAPAAATVAPAPGGSPVPPADLVAQQEKNFQEIMEQLRRSPHPPQEKIRILKSRFLRPAKYAEGTTGIKLSVIAKAEKEIAALEKQLSEESSAAFEQLQEAVAPLLSGATADFEQAGRLVGEFRERYKNIAVDAQALALEERVLRCSSAERELEARKMKLRDDDYVWNIALFEGFDPQYKDTPAAEVVQQIIARNYRAFSERRSADAEAVKNAKWEDYNVQDFGVLWPLSPPADFKDGVLSIGPNTKESTGDEPDTCLRFGDDNWVDVELRFEAQIGDSKGIIFGARGWMEQNATYNFSWKELSQIEMPADTWSQFFVRIDGTSMTITGGGKTITSNRLRTSPGPFGIRVRGENSLIRLRNMQCWVKKREGSAAGDDEKAGKKKKKSKTSKKKESDKKEGGKS